MDFNTVGETDATIKLDLNDLSQRLDNEGLHGIIIHVIAIILDAILSFRANIFIKKHQNELVPGTNNQRYVRNGYHPVRTIGVALGIAVALRVPRILDRCPDLPGDRFEAGLIGKYQKVTDQVREFALALYAKGASLVNIGILISILFKKDIVGFKKSNLSLLKESWQESYYNFQHNDLSRFQNHILIIDGTYFKVKDHDDKTCVLAAIVVDDDKYTVVGWQTALSESESEWSRFFEHLVKVQGMGQPLMVLTDGGTGALAAIAKYFSEAKVQRCWVHKVRNIMGLLPLKERKEAAALLRNIYTSESKEAAYDCYQIFITYYASRPNIINCLKKDINNLLSFFDIDNVRRKKLYTTNCIESLFSIVKSSFNSIRGSLSFRTLSFTSYKLIEHLETYGDTKDAIDVISKSVQSKRLQVANDDLTPEPTASRAGPEPEPTDQANDAASPDRAPRPTPAGAATDFADLRKPARPCRDWSVSRRKKFDPHRGPGRGNGCHPLSEEAHPFGRDERRRQASSMVARLEELGGKARPAPRTLLLYQYRAYRLLGRPRDPPSTSNSS